jgi:hypothetical protein
MLFNPLADNFEDLTDSQLQEKVQDLTRRYYQTRNPGLQNQIAVMLDMFRQEQTARMYKQKQQDDDNPDLDNLININ